MDLQTKILRYLEKKKCVWVIKAEVTNQRGCPDILCCAHGKFLAIEVKSKNDNLSPIQVEQMRRIREAGGKTMVVRNFDNFKEIYEMYEKICRTGY